MLKQFFIILSLTIVATVAVPAFADFNPPAFPVCTSPQGSVIAQYDTGTHAIAGADESKEGADIVYKLDDNLNMAMQCFCPPAPQTLGIQTNWLKADTLSEEQKQQMENNGWIYISNGPGLANAPYMAQNSTYSCTATIQAVEQGQSQTPTPSICNTLSPTETPSATPSPIPTSIITPTPTGNMQLSPTPITSNTTPGTSPTPIVANVESITATNNAGTPNSSSNTTTLPSSNGTPSSPGPTTLPNTGGSIELFATILTGITSLGISLLLKKAA